jgi:hypothetical protein
MFENSYNALLDDASQKLILIDKNLEPFPVFFDSLYPYPFPLNQMGAVFPVSRFYH